MILPCKNDIILGRGLADWPGTALGALVATRRTFRWSLPILPGEALGTAESAERERLIAADALPAAFAIIREGRHVDRFVCSIRCFGRTPGRPPRSRRPGPLLAVTATACQRRRRIIREGRFRIFIVPVSSAHAIESMLLEFVTTFNPALAICLHRQR